jgi:type III secretory pathway component EscS
MNHVPIIMEAVAEDGVMVVVVEVDTVIVEVVVVVVVAAEVIVTNVQNQVISPVIALKVIIVVDKEAAQPVNKAKMMMDNR